MNTYKDNPNQTEAETGHFENINQQGRVSADQLDAENNGVFLEQVGSHKVVNTKDHVAGNAFLVGGHGEVRLVPIPSANPNDPLNFTKWKKYGIIVACCWFSTMSLSSTSGISSFLEILVELYAPEESQEQVNLLSTMPSAALGAGSFVIIPFALIAGRRPLFLICTVVMLGALIGAALCQTYEQHLVFRVFQGLGASASESLLPLMITEVTFLHQRGFIFGIFWACQNIIQTALNIAASYIAASSATWRWYYGIMAFFVGGGMIVAFLFAAETRFSRPPMAMDGQIIITDDFGVTHVLSDEEARERLANLDEVQTYKEIDTSIPVTPWLKTLNPWSGLVPNAKEVLLGSILKILEAFTSPALVWTMVAGGTVFGCSLGMAITFSIVLTSDFGWSTKAVGLMGSGTIPAACLSVIYSGWLADKFVVWKAKRNGGIHEPEARLILLIPVTAVCITMLMIYGMVCDEPEKYSSWGIVFAWNVYQWGFISMLIITTTFASEVKPKDPGPALILVCGGRFLVSFGLQYGFVPLEKSHGYLVSQGIFAAIFGGVMLLGIPVYFINPWWRKRIAEIERDLEMKRKSRELEISA